MQFCRKTTSQIQKKFHSHDLGGVYQEKTFFKPIYCALKGNDVIFPGAVQIKCSRSLPNKNLEHLAHQEKLDTYRRSRLFVAGSKELPVEFMRCHVLDMFDRLGAKLLINEF